MTPNLTQLFAERHATAKDGSSQAEVLAFALQQKCARDTLRALFDCHGEALIKELERARDDIHDEVCIFGPGHTVRCEELTQFLDQLEKEAQR